MMDVAKGLRLALEKSGVSQSALSREIGVSRMSVSDWCKGKKNPSAEHLISVCKALGLSLDDLLKGAGEPTRYPKPIAMKEKLDYALCQCEGKCLAVQSKMTLGELASIASNGKPIKGFVYLVCENRADGVVIRVKGNKRRRRAEVIGFTCGYGDGSKHDAMSVGRRKRQWERK